MVFFLVGSGGREGEEGGKRGGFFFCLFGDSCWFVGFFVLFSLVGFLPPFFPPFYLLIPLVLHYWDCSFSLNLSFKIISCLQGGLHFNAVPKIVSARVTLIMELKFPISLAVDL